MTTHQRQGFFFPRAPFDFEQTLAFVCEFPPTAGEQQLQASSLKKAMLVNGQPLLFEISSVGTVDAPRMRYQLWSHSAISDDTEARVLDRIRFFISADDELEAFYALARRDACFWPVAQRRYGFHQPKFFTPFENAAWAVMTQRMPIRQARPIKDAFVERYGSSFVDGEMVHHAFPDASRVAAIPQAELEGVLRNARKATYLHAVAAAFSDVDEAFLRHGAVDEVYAWLRQIPGMGPWSSAFVAIRGLGRMERVDVEESRVLNVAQAVYGRLSTLTPARVQQIVDGYGAWKGYWALYMRASEQTMGGRVRRNSRSGDRREVVSPPH